MKFVQLFLISVADVIIDLNFESGLNTTVTFINQTKFTQPKDQIINLNTSKLFVSQKFEVQFNFIIP